MFLRFVKAEGETNSPELGEAEVCVNMDGKLDVTLVRSVFRFSHQLRVQGSKFTEDLSSFFSNLSSFSSVCFTSTSNNTTRDPG